ncbi:MAG TPA: hypothetical protein VLG72_02985 [Nitrospirota bacterium]|nr:hypothetical protein [Nitrospirota bacterium]
MFRLLQSFFGFGDAIGGYPESLVNRAIERAVDGTDPCLRTVSGYKRKLRPAVISAIDYVIALVDRLPPPVSVDLERRSEDPLLRAFFISHEELRKVFGKDSNLARFMRGSPGVPDKVFALLAMEKIEKVIFGAELSGDIVMRDVPQMTVCFEAHRLIDPSDSEVETRRLLKRRAYDHLVSLALRQITTTKTERKDLERRHALFQSKLNIMLRGGWGFEGDVCTDNIDISWLEEQIEQIETQLLEIGGDDRMFNVYLDILIQVLGGPGEHLWGTKETLFLDGMGIKRNQAAPNVHELNFPEISNSEGRRLVMLLVTLSGEELRSLLA